MADAVTNFAALTNDAPNVYIARETYRLAERRMVIGRHAKLHQMPQRMGKTLRIIRYSRINLPTGVLTEGTPPDAVALATENVDVTVEQWGIVVLLTDVAQITTTHPALQIAIDRTAMAMAEVLEREQAQMLLAGTSVFYPGSVTARSGIGTSDKLDTATILKTTVSLRNLGASEYEDGLFHGVLPPQMEGDIVSADQTFKDASNFANVRKLEYNEIGVWMGVRWSRGNFLPIFKGVGAPAAQTATAELTDINAGSGTTANGAKFIVVARDATTNYVRKVSQASAAMSGQDSGAVEMPTSANYVYDVYVSDDGTNPYVKVASRKAHTASAGTVATLFGLYATPVDSESVPAIPASGREVFVSWVFGREAFGRVELNGMSLQSYITPAGASYSNPLAQGRKVGSKIMWKSFIIDNNFFARIEAASAYSAGLPA
jgi:N4-gp56 family major capsid protein